MQITDATWEAYQADDSKQYEIKIVIDGDDEYTESHIFSARLTSSLGADTEFGIGNVCASQFSMILRLKSEIPKMATVEPYIRMNGTAGPSAWIPQGLFYIDTRQKAGQAMEFECIDKALMLEKPFWSETIDDFPMTQLDAIDEISQRLDCSFSNPDDLNAGFEIGYTSEQTMREVLGYIASANAGNFVFGEDGNLRFVKVENATSIGTSSYRSFKIIDDVQVYDKIAMVYGEDGEAYVSGSGSNELEIYNPHATQAAADYVVSVISAYTHRPFVCAGAYINPAAQLGDSVTIDGTDYMIYKMVRNYGAGMPSDISSPGNTELTHEYAYSGNYARQIQRKVSLGTNYYGTTINRSDGLKIKRGDGDGEIILNADTFSMRAMDGGAMVDKLYFDAALGKFVFDGEINAGTGKIGGWDIEQTMLSASTGDIEEDLTTQHTDTWIYPDGTCDEVEVLNGGYYVNITPYCDYDVTGTIGNYIIFCNEILKSGTLPDFFIDELTADYKIPRTSKYSIVYMQSLMIEPLTVTKALVQNRSIGLSAGQEYLGYSALSISPYESYPVGESIIRLFSGLTPDATPAETKSPFYLTDSGLVRMTNFLLDGDMLARDPDGYNIAISKGTLLFQESGTSNIAALSHNLFMAKYQDGEATAYPFKIEWNYGTSQKMVDIYSVAGKMSGAWELQSPSLSSLAEVSTDTNGTTPFQGWRIWIDGDGKIYKDVTVSTDLYLQ